MLAADTLVVLTGIDDVQNGATLDIVRIKKLT